MTRWFTVLACIALTGCGAAPREKLPQVVAVKGWPQVVQGSAFGEVSAVAVGPGNRIYVLHRPGRPWKEPFPTTPIAAPTVTVFDGASGKSLDQWGAGSMVMPHGLSIGPDGNVWITDAGLEQVLRFTPQGKLTLAIGTRGVTGDDATHFGRPTDIAFLDNHLLVSDGYLNGRVAEYDLDGHFLGQFGTKGPEPGQFKVPHSIAVADGWIVVADRENGRIEAFDKSGKLLADWTEPGRGHPYAVKPMPDGQWVSLEGRDDHDRQGIVLRLYTASGKLERSFAVASVPGDKSRGHDLAVGPDGAIYIADVTGERVVKLAPGSLKAR